MLAAQALTVQAASGGRLTLGIGLSHQMVIENVFGHVLRQAGPPHARVPGDPDAAAGRGAGDLRRGDDQGLDLRPARRSTAPAPDVLVAALGTVMLDIAGRLAAGTITWMTGPATIEDAHRPDHPRRRRRGRPARAPGRRWACRCA